MARPTPTLSALALAGSFALVALSTLSTTPARAEPVRSTLGLKIDEPEVVFAESGTADAWERHPYAVLARLETFGPIGLGGVGFEAGFGRYFSLGVGAGSTSNDVQAASMARFRWPLGVNAALGVGVGVSYGRAFDGGACFDASSSCAPSRPRVVSADGELSLEGRSDEGFLIRLYGGLHRNLDHQQQLFPYAGLAIGFAL